MTSLENSMINKTYMFQFVNLYISNFVYIFYHQNFTKLQVNIVTVMVFKQIGYNILEYGLLKCKVEWKLRKITKLFNTRFAQIRGKHADAQKNVIEEEDLKMHREIEKQQQMEAAPRTLVFFYNEAVIQMGFIAFFAVAFPFAPLFSFFTNLLEIKIKLQTMSEYGRRSQAAASNGIGNWMSIIGFISFFAIPINICILLFARSPADRRVGALQDADTIDLEENSAMV